MDFAEHFSCFSQDEIQGAHWSHDSVTIHPIIARYRCPCQECDQMVVECFDIVSDYLCHDSHAVHTFTQKLFEHLKYERKIETEHAIIISDGCASQYKSKIPFMDVSCSLDDFGVTTERCYYGARHGKNRCDGEAGVVKSFARRAVMNGAVIKDAKSFLDAVKALEISSDPPCKHNLRKVIFVSSEDIERDRPQRNAKTVPGTIKIHSVCGISRGKLLTRRLSCFCSQCLKKCAPCLNQAYVDSRKMVIMKPLIPLPAPNPIVTDTGRPEEPVLLNTVPADTAPVGLAPMETASAEMTRLPPPLDFMQLDTTLDIGLGAIDQLSMSPDCSFSEIKTNSSYTEGTNLKVQHGTETYPAVVDSWPWVKYFQRQKSGWVLQETKHEDVLGVLFPPDLRMIGCRFFYLFEELGTA